MRTRFERRCHHCRVPITDSLGRHPGGERNWCPDPECQRQAHNLRSREWYHRKKRRSLDAIATKLGRTA